MGSQPFLLESSLAWVSCWTKDAEFQGAWDGLDASLCVSWNVHVLEPKHVLRKLNRIMKPSSSRFWISCSFRSVAVPGVSKPAETAGEHRFCFYLVIIVWRSQERPLNTGLVNPENHNTLQEYFILSHGIQVWFCSFTIRKLS